MRRYPVVLATPGYPTACPLLVTLQVDALNAQLLAANPWADPADAIFPLEDLLRDSVGTLHDAPSSRYYGYYDGAYDAVGSDPFDDVYSESDADPVNDGTGLDDASFANDGPPEVRALHKAPASANTCAAWAPVWTCQGVRGVTRADI